MKSNDQGKTPVAPPAPSLGSEKPFIVPHGFKPNLKVKKSQELLKLSFLDSFYKNITVSHTASACGVNIKQLDSWRESDHEFARAYQVCQNAITDRFERIAAARGVGGSDNLLMFILKKRDPSFRDKVQSEIDPRVVDSIVNSLVDALRKSVPESCPHCKTNLGLTEKVTVMLSDLSKSMGK